MHVKLETRQISDHVVFDSKIYFLFPRQRISLLACIRPQPRWKTEIPNRASLENHVLSVRAP